MNKIQEPANGGNIIFPPVRNALASMLAGYHAGIENKDGRKLENTEDVFEQLLNLYNRPEPFMGKVETLDRLVQRHPDFEDLKEVLFDLLLINFLAGESLLLDENYLDSQEWLKIEDQTIDRGTELLNLLLYINEANDEEIEVSLDDFLKEFLLVEDDEFQDEFVIYEDVLSNQELIEHPVEEIIDVSNKIKNESPVKDIFLPMMVFFSSPEDSQRNLEILLRSKKANAVEIAILALLHTYKNQRAALPANFIKLDS